MPHPTPLPDLFEALFTLSLTGTVLYDPVHDETGQVVNFTFARLNPATQRLLGLPARPAVTFLQQFPGSVAAGIWAFHHEAFLAGEPRELRQHYQADGYDSYYVVAAQRVGEQLLVTFLDTGDQPRTPVEEVLRESKAREQQALTETRYQQQLLQQVFEHAPMPLALFRGDNYVVELANPALARLWGCPLSQIVGRPVFEALPDLRDQGFDEILGNVMRTGQPFRARGLPAVLDRASLGLPALGYFDISYEALYEVPGKPATGLTVTAVEVTGQVLARQQIQRLNQELEARVQERTQQLEVARAATERQRRQWHELFMRAPAAICIFDGPEWVYEFVNPGYQAMFPGRALLGKRLVDALPEVADQPLMAILHHVYDTGETFAQSAVLVRLARTEGGPIEDIFFDLTYQARYNDDGQINGFITYAYDVTEQVRARHQADTLQAALLTAAQQQAQQREELYQVFEQAPAAIVLLREPNHRVEYVNPAYAQLFPGVALQGRILQDVQPDIATNGTLAWLDRVYATGEPYTGEEQLMQLTLTPGQPPQTRYFNFSYQPYREQGRIMGISVFAYDVTGAALARQAIAANARQLRLLTDALPVLISYLDREERYQFTNEAYRTWFNQDPQALLGCTVRDIVGEKAYANAKPYIDRALAGERLDFTSQMPYRENFVKYISTSYVPDEQAGELRGFYTLVTDITEQVLARQQVELANQELEARVQERTQQLAAAQAEAEHERGELERVLEQAPVAIAVYRGPAYVVELANAAVARLWGRTREQLLGKPIYEALPEAAGLGYEELMDGVMATGMPHVAQAMASRHERDGHLDTIYWDFVYVPMPEADGRITGVMVVATDVTAQVLARRQIEQLNQDLEARVLRRTRQLTEQQTLLRQILGQVPASIATLSGPEHRYSFFNELYLSLTANRAELSHAVAEVLPELVEQGFVGLLDEVYATGQPFIGTDRPALFYDAQLGQPRQYYLDFIYQPLFDDQQRVQGILAFVLDVTDRTRARQLVEHSQLQVQELNDELAVINEELRATNEELHNSNTRLTRTNTDLDTFVYTASHDLKAPITNIEGILAALRETLPPEVQQQDEIAYIMGLLHTTVSRFLTTIDQLTDLSRLQQTYNEPTELLALAPIVADVLADLAPAIAAAAAQLYLDVPAGLRVSFAPASLRSVVYNLLSNAVKYRDPARPAQVWLRAKAQPGAVILTVRDNGLGLSESQQQRLFGVFQRLHTHVEGTGVGLYMIKRLIDNAGASITVTSTPQVGSTFTVSFPT
ncbi:MAG: PAS domain-containing protein [Janthinobacterium lividum]